MPKKKELTNDELVLLIKQDFNSFDDRMDKMSLEIVIIKEDIKDIRENMMNKQDKNDIMGALDQVITMQKRIL